VTITAERLLRRGIQRQESGHLDEAEAIYGTLVERDRDNADAWHLLSRVSLSRGQWKEAAARVLQAIRRHPEIPAFHSTLGEILAVQGRTWEASLCFQEAVRLSPGFRSALVNLGIALQNQGQHRDACVAYWRAIQAEPDCAAAFRCLANALRAQGRFDEALECDREALRLRSDPAKAPVPPQGSDGSPAPVKKRGPARGST